jgi:hypothetical protein
MSNDNTAMLPTADPLALLEAFLTAHASREAVPMVLFTRGEELYLRLANNPPAHPSWGRFLVALGQLAADHLDDGAAASRYFLQALQGLAQHGDNEAAVTAGYNQGVLQERRRREAHALSAYRLAAQEGFRCGCITANTVRAATAAVRLRFAEDGQLGDCLPLAKQGWLGWLYLRTHQPEQIDDALHQDCCRLLAALLLPEDDPGLLMAAWHSWAPDHIVLPDHRTWNDHHCRSALALASAEAADLFLSDESENPGEPYRILLHALRRAGAP